MEENIITENYIVKNQENTCFYAQVSFVGINLIVEIVPVFVVILIYYVSIQFSS